MPDFEIRYDTLDGLPIIDSPVATWSQKPGCRHLHAFTPTRTGLWRSLCQSVTMAELPGADLSLSVCTDCDFKEARLRRERKAPLPVVQPRPAPRPEPEQPQSKIIPGGIRRRSLDRMERGL